MHRSLTLVAALLAVLELGTHGLAAERRVSLTLTRLKCEAVTGDQEDEIYIMVAGRRTGGADVAKRVPDEWWDMIPASVLSTLDGRVIHFNEKTVPGSPVLWEGELEEGHSVNLTIFIMEADRQKDPKGDPLRMAQAAADATDPDDDQTIGTKANVLELLEKHVWSQGSGVIKDTDDCPGVIAVKMKNNKGNLEVKWSVRERGQDKGHTNDARHFTLTGDSSQFQLYLKAK